MAEAMLEPNLYGGRYYFYLEPNPALTEILMGPRLQAITAEWTAKVVTGYLTRLEGRGAGGGPLAGSVRAEVFIGGYKTDRWVGQIVVGGGGVTYAAADEFGRSNPVEGQNNSTYEGSHDLREALYAELPRI